MNASTFDIANPDTWPVILTAQHIADIFHRPIGGIKTACKRKRFQPEPYQVKPYAWRKVDVVRFVEGGRGVGLRRVG
jgi:hypothetical protein